MTQHWELISDQSQVSVQAVEPESEGSGKGMLSTQQGRAGVSLGIKQKND